MHVCSAGMVSCGAGQLVLFLFALRSTSVYMELHWKQDTRHLWWWLRPGNDLQWPTNDPSVQYKTEMPENADSISAVPNPGRFYLFI